MHGLPSSVIAPCTPTAVAHSTSKPALVFVGTLCFNADNDKTETSPPAVAPLPCRSLTLAIAT